jgi:hypothetical protein
MNKEYLIFIFGCVVGRFAQWLTDCIMNYLHNKKINYYATRHDLCIQGAA